MPVRRRQRHRDAGGAHRGGRVRLALLPAQRGPGPALRVPGARSLPARPRPPVQPGQAAARPVREGDRGDLRWHQALFSYQHGDPGTLNNDDSAPFMPRNVVINPYFDWGDDRPPRTPYHETLIYEAHVRGLTVRHPEVPAEQRGTLRRAGPSRGPRAPDPAGGDRGRADAGAPVGARARAGPARADQLLGLQHDRVPRAGQPVLLIRPRPTARSPSSRRWSRPCTRRASR